MKVKNVEKVGGSKFLTLYKLTLSSADSNGHEVLHDWFMSSRHSDASELECLTNKQNIDTVCIVPKFKGQDGRIYYVIIEEQRPPIGHECFSFPAGLIDNGEPKLSAALRELEEETGVQIESGLVPVGDVYYNSEGMTDETVQMFTVDLGTPHFEKQNLQGFETLNGINLHFVAEEDLEAFKKSKPFATKAGVFVDGVIENYKMRQQLKKTIEKTIPGCNLDINRPFSEILADIQSLMNKALGNSGNQNQPQ